MNRASVTEIDQGLGQADQRPQLGVMHVAAVAGHVRALVDNVPGCFAGD